MEKGLYYLAIPYQGSEEEKKYRTEFSLKVTTEFLRQGIHLFSPVIYVNKIAEELGLSSLEKRREIIMPYLFDFLKVSKGLILIKIDGWQKSWGVQQELKFCREAHIPVFTMQADEIAKNLPKILSASLGQLQLSSLLEKV
ncbi:MAG: DUF1937 family protein [Proteobacteria bacterium]|nr:DUF1937 family protein [Pseudomonadota bacterium]